MQVIVERYLAPATTGRKASEISGIVHDWERHVANMRFDEFVLELALCYHCASSLSIPLAHLRGGKSRDSLDYTWPLGVLPLEQAVAELEERIASHGHQSL